MNQGDPDGFPTHASVVVIGGGILGCSTLYHLAEAGVTDAVLVERNQLTSGTTWHSAAQVRALRSSRNLTRLARYSIDLYTRLEAETEQATGWLNTGSLSIATTPDRLTHIRRQESLARLFGMAAEFIGPDEAAERWPQMRSDDVIGAVWSPDDGRVNPSDLCAALIRGSRQRGARRFENTGVTAIITQGGTTGQKVVGVETTRGTITCDAVAICAGLWSREAAAMAGVSAPVWPCEHFFALSKPSSDDPLPHLPTLSDHDAHLYIRDEVGGLLIGCFEPMGKPIAPDSEVLGPDFAFGLLDEDWDHFMPMALAAQHRVPMLEGAEIKMLLNGPESFTPDGMFLLGEAPETGGVFLGCGMNSVGVATGGGAGMALAHNIVHGHLPFDLQEADPSRFHGVYSSVDVLVARAPEILGRHYEISYPGRSVDSARDLRHLPLHDAWVKAGAWCGQVDGWERPLYFDAPGPPELTFDRPAWFDQVGREVTAATGSLAVFDQSTLGKIRVRGAGAEAFLDRLCANDLTRPPGAVIYTPMLNERGGYVDDLTVQRLGPDDYRLFVGSTAVRRDLAWMRRHLDPSEDVRLVDETAEWCVLALMGPDAVVAADALNAGWLNEMPYFAHRTGVVAGYGEVMEVGAARLSYVGERGWEIICSPTEVSKLLRWIRGAGARPAGLYAQTSMRIEKGFRAMGHELDSDIGPIEAGLGFAVDLGRGTDFVGRQALLTARETPPVSRVVSLVFDDHGVVPIGGEPLVVDGEPVGQVTSAAYGYRVGAPVALALVRAEALEHDRLEVDIAGLPTPVTASLACPFDPDGSRMRSR